MCAAMVCCGRNAFRPTSVSAPNVLSAPRAPGRHARRFRDQNVAKRLRSVLTEVLRGTRTARRHREAVIHDHQHLARGAPGGPGQGNLDYGAGRTTLFVRNGARRRSAWAPFLTAGLGSSPPAWISRRVTGSAVL